MNGHLPEAARRPVRIAAFSGYYGDRPTAAREQLDGGQIDVLVGDYLAELTMTVLAKDLHRTGGGYARTFPAQVESVLADCLDRSVKIVVNAGGLNPAGLAAQITELGARMGLVPKVAWIEGDDLRDRIDDLRGAGNPLAHLDTGAPLAHTRAGVIAANAYLGGWGIAEALAGGADIVIAPRVADASLVLGAAAWWHSWVRTDWDRLAGAVAAGHVIECGTQATGGNYPFVDEAAAGPPGFPIAEIADDGSSVITKHPGTGGGVSLGTVTAQLVYEIGSPAYLTPDVVSHFDSLALARLGPDQIQITGSRGSAPPPTLKVGLVCEIGFSNQMTLVFTGDDIDTKAAQARDRILEQLGDTKGMSRFEWTRLHARQGDTPVVLDTLHVRSEDKAMAGRRFSNAVTETALASYAGFFCTGPPTLATACTIFWPTLVDATAVDHELVLPSGQRRTIASVPTAAPPAAWLRGHPVKPAPSRSGETRRVPLGTVCGARSGDKAGNANVGLWTWDNEAYEWLSDYCIPDRLRAMIHDSGDLEIRRWELPNLRALNFVVIGLLGLGGGDATRLDPMAKGLGEAIRASLVDIPAALLDRLPPRSRR